MDALMQLGCRISLGSYSSIGLANAFTSPVFAAPAAAAGAAQEPAAAAASAARSNREVLEALKVELGLPGYTWKGVIDYADRELELRLAGTTRDKLKRIAEELGVPTGW